MHQRFLSDFPTPDFPVYAVCEGVCYEEGKSYFVMVFHDLVDCSTDVLFCDDHPLVNNPLAQIKCYLGQNIKQDWSMRL